MYLPTYKRIALLLFSLLFFNPAYSQTQDLIKLAQGDFLGMNALFDEKGSLFGYISIYDYGKVSDTTKKFEYVIMDKNLNPFANNTFEGDLTAGDYAGYMSFDGKIILRPSQLDYRYVKQKEMFTPFSMEIDLKTNTIRKKIFYDYDHGDFKEIHEHNSWSQNKKDYKAEKKKNGFNYISHTVEIKEGGYLVYEYDDYDKYEKNNRLTRYDENKKELWHFSINENGSASESRRLTLLDKNHQYYYGLLQENAGWSKKYYMLVLDMKTGKTVYKNEIADKDNVLSNISHFSTLTYGSIDNSKSFDDKIVVVGRMMGKNLITREYAGLVLPEYKGYARLVIDKKTFWADLKTITYDHDIRPFIPQVNSIGLIKGYLLEPRDILFLQDGSVGLLFEKYKPASQYTAAKTLDMVYVHTDKDFKVTSAKILEKEKTRWNSDYLFSQSLNDGKDAAFFYWDYQKNDDSRGRNWNLFINTIIDGNFKQEMVPMSARKDYLIIPYLAKEGYILLQEFNTKAKYNQVRLERLNY
jgi:hypothetical protein